MHHSNIVPIFGTGESDGTRYLVMQLVDSESLNKQIASTRIVPLRSAAFLISPATRLEI